MADKITIDVGGKLANVPIEAALSSELIKERIELLGTEYVFPMPDKYYNVAGNYINFLNGKPTQITTTSKLEMCFDMESYLDDPNYFQYLLRQMFGLWSSIGSDFLYGDLNPNIRRSVLLWCPYDFVPIEYIDNAAFFKQWLINNENSEITVDDITSQHDNKINSKLYFTFVERYDSGSIKELITYHTEAQDIKAHSIEVGYKTIVEYNPDGTISSESTYYNRKLQDGIEKEWFVSGNLKSQVSKVNGNLDGKYLVWYDNNSNQLKSSTSYSNGKLDGPTIVYNRNGTKISETYYHDNELHGQHKVWYAQDQLEVDGQYLYGEKSGLWTNYNRDGSINNQGEYKHGLKTGFWVESSYEEVYNDDDEEEVEIISVVREGEYKNGYYVGIWTTTDNHGNILPPKRY